MKAAIIGAGGEALHTIKKAHEHGLSVVALDGNPQAEGLKAADQKFVIDISNEDVTIETLKRERPDFVLTAPIGRYLTTIGAVNDALGLPGVSKETAVLCTDKLKFHETLSKKNLRKCHCFGIDVRAIADTDGEISEERAFQMEHSVKNEFFGLTFPAILKPRYGSGSRGIYMLADKQQLKEALCAVGREPYVLEECVAGEEYGVDGAVTKDGFFMILLRKKENTPPPSRQAVGYFSVLPDDSFWQQVKNYMAEVIACLGLEECLLHADVIRTGQGPFVVELSARPSGHNLHNLFTPLCTGVDMAEEYIKYRMGLPYCFEAACTKPMMIHYFDMQGTVREVPDQNRVEMALNVKLAAWQCNLKEGDELTNVSNGHSLMGRGFFVLEGKADSDLLVQAQRIKSLFL